MIEIPEYVTPEKVDVQKIEEEDLVKVRFTLDGKRYKMLLSNEVFSSLETAPGQVIKELALRGGDEERHSEWLKQNGIDEAKLIMVGRLADED